MSHKYLFKISFKIYKVILKVDNSCMLTEYNDKMCNIIVGLGS